MTEHLTEDLEEQATRRFCPWCGKPTNASGPYCGECGGALAGDTGAETNGTQEETNGSNGAQQPGYEAQTSAPAVPPYPYPGSYPVPAPQPSGNAGLIAALASAVLLAAGVIAAVVLLASSGGGSGPTIAPTRNAAAVSPVSTPPSGGGLAVGGAAKSSSPNSTPAPASASSSSSSSSSASTASVADAQSIQTAIQQHWALISQSNFAGAFAQMNPNDYDRSSWIQGEQASAPTSASVSVGQPTFSSATSANAPLLSLHTVSSDGCANWSGSYDMTKISGSWLISTANLTKQAC